MKSIAIIFSLFFIGTNLMAQDCTTTQNGDRTIVSTKKQKVGVNKVTVGTNNFAYIKFSREDKIYCLNLEIETRSPRILDKGDTILFTFDDKSYFELYTSAIAKPEAKDGKAFTQGTDQTIWYTNPLLYPTQEQMKSFAFKQLVSIRSGAYVYNITKPEVLSLMMGCVYKN